VRIAMIGIAVGMALMILSTAIVKGFQREIRQTVVGFGSHFQVVDSKDNLSGDSQRLLFSDSVYRSLKSIQGVSHVQVFAARPAILESKEGLQGCLLKGVDLDFQWDFLRKTLVRGSVPSINGDTLLEECLISAMVARRLRIDTGSVVSLYVINNRDDARQRNLNVCGIYETGLEDFDAKLVFTDIRHVRELSGWALQAQVMCDTVCTDGAIMVGGLAFGGRGAYEFTWNNAEWVGEGPHFISSDRDTLIRLILKDDAGSAPDTASVLIDFLDDTSPDPCRAFRVLRKDKPDLYGGYIGGYEVLIEDYTRLFEADDAIYEAIPYKLQVENITRRSPEIFSWLEMLDVNVWVIVILMVVISIINMTSALLIIILEKQPMVGTLKAFGMQNTTLMRIFLLTALSVIGRGMLLGNVIGIGVAVVQYYFHILPLDPEQYYVSSVPIMLDWQAFAVLNLLTIIVCTLALLIPALFVAAITPIKAIRFN
jgi:lipoprotein-releasing system permease protein